MQMKKWSLTFFEEYIYERKNKHLQLGVTCVDLGLFSFSENNETAQIA